MNHILTKNCKHLKIKQIPVLNSNEFIEENYKLSQNNFRPLSFFVCKNDSKFQIFSFLAEDSLSQIAVFSTIVNKDFSYPNLTSRDSRFQFLERDIYERYGIIPVSHPWLKPIRSLDYDFFTISDEKLHQVGVGPVHAGVIEPGHFRFLCSGETVKHLEIQLGYQHRGIEKIITQSKLKDKNRIIESVAGDTVMGNCFAYTQLAEALSQITVSPRTKIIRGIVLEMERVAIHIGDLSALANDIAYQPASSYLGAFRTLIINSLLKVSGSRFGRGLFKVGGLNFDIDNDLALDLKKTINKVSSCVNEILEIFFSQPSVLSRLENTGTVDLKTAKSIPAKGLSARASGLKVDVRSDHPTGIYQMFPYDTICLESGDVFARAYIRYLEIKKSVHYILGLIDLLNNTHNSPSPDFNLPTDSLCISLTEGWRGEIIHIATTNDSAKINNYNITDPSVHNWFALAMALRENGISDFPLCNKSFNLSYCGNDL